VKNAANNAVFSSTKGITQGNWNHGEAASERAP
jgi:hypothetical protein